jgi:hypothetical protein
MASLADTATISAKRSEVVTEEGAAGRERAGKLDGVSSPGRDGRPGGGASN